MACLTLRNSIRAVVQNGVRQGAGADAAAPIEVHACVAKSQSGAMGLTLRVSDEGGGIPRSEVPKVMKYLYTTTTELLTCTRSGGVMAAGDSPPQASGGTPGLLSAFS